MDKKFSDEIIISIIEQFVEQVERRAENKMLLTGKLEGAHYAAMKEILAEIKAGEENG